MLLTSRVYIQFSGGCM